MESEERPVYEYIDINVWNISQDNNSYYTYMEEQEEFLHFINVTSILIPVLFGAITIFGLLGNILTITVIQLHKAYRGITKYLILNLSIADLIFIMLCIPFKAVYSARHYWPFGDRWCRIHTYLEYVFYFASMYILVLISLDRYIALVHPIKSMMLRTRRNCFISLVALWSFVILGNIPFLFIAEEININPENIDEDKMICTLNFEDVAGSSICLFVFAYLLPLTLLCLLYGHMLKVFLTGKPPSSHKNGDQIRFQAKKRLIKMVISIVSVFVICWMPLQIIMVVISHVPPEEGTSVTLGIIIYVAQCMAYMNSCINPILYTIYTHKFRSGIVNILCCRKTECHERSVYSSVKRGSRSSALTTSFMA